MPDVVSFRKILALWSIVLAFALSSPALASTWITLGTQGGPMPDASRSQPANALVTEDGVYVIDAGDGTAEQLAKADIALARVKAVVLSHLHFDHTAGLFGLLSLRWQTNIKSPLTIYGPPGTRKLVDGILAAMGPAVEAGYAYPGEFPGPFAHGVEVVEIRDGATFSLASTNVVAAKNSHYSFPAGSADDRNFESLSFRFEARDRVIAYTGDTGPSGAVERLAKGADLLVSEMIDFDRTVAEIRRVSPNMPEGAMTGLMTHLREHHMTPQQVGALARAAGAGSVVVTHISAPGLSGKVAVEYLDGIAQAFSGPVVLARDLDGF